MPRLIFDIETIGVDFDSLDEKSKEFLLNYAKSDEDKENIKNNLGFSPLTGQVVAIGILNPDTDKGAVYFQAPDKESEKIDEEDIQYISFPDEKGVLKQFWDVATHYNQFITFNGYAFDCPYLMIRSAVLKVKPTVNLMRNRYSLFPHLDILDYLTNFGAGRWRSNLHLWCRAFGIESPKDQGITGKDVPKLFKDKKYLDIARYCFGDLRATKELLERWEKYINIEKK